jgi:hypothetical protein
MARSKSTENKSSENKLESDLDHAYSFAPSVKHERSATEQAIVDRYFEQTKQHAPQLKVSHGDGIVKIGADHRDPQLGTVLLMDALGTAK